MKQFLSLFTLILSFCMIGCSTDISSEHAEDINILEVPTLKTINVLNTSHIQELFGQYSSITRGVVPESNDNLYDFNNAEIKMVEGKEALIYEIPAMDNSNLEKILVGIGSEESINVKMYFEETSDYHYTLYNQDREKIFDVYYDINNNLINFTKFYDNDVINIPSTRAVDSRTWSILCNGVLATGTTGLALIGAIASAGATIGMAACGYIISMALC